jgi:hypothetical protein
MERERERWTKENGYTFKWVEYRAGDGSRESGIQQFFRPDVVDAGGRGRIVGSVENCFSPADVLFRVQISDK